MMIKIEIEIEKLNLFKYFLCNHKLTSKEAEGAKEEQHQKLFFKLFPLFAHFVRVRHNKDNEKEL